VIAQPLNAVHGQGGWQGQGAGFVPDHGGQVHPGDLGPVLARRRICDRDLRLPANDLQDRLSQEDIEHAAMGLEADFPLEGRAALKPALGVEGQCRFVHRKMKPPSGVRSTPPAMVIAPPAPST